MKACLLAELMILTYALAAVAQTEAPPPSSSQQQVVPETAVAPVPELVRAPPPSVFSRHVLGLYGGVGIAHVYHNMDNHELDPRVTGAGEIHYHIFFNRMIGLNIGFGFQGKGYTIPAEETISGDDTTVKWLVAEMPFGLILNIRNFRLGINTVANLGVKVKINGEDPDAGFWDVNNRFNLASRLTIGGRIPLARQHHFTLTAIFELDAFNRLKSDGSMGDYEARFINIFAMMGYEFGS